MEPFENCIRMWLVGSEKIKLVSTITIGKL